MGRRLLPRSKLGHFVVKRRIPMNVLADFAGCSLRYLYTMNSETANPSQRFMNRVTIACRLLTNEHIRVSQLFDLEE